MSESPETQAQPESPERIRSLLDTEIYLERKKQELIEEVEKLEREVKQAKEELAWKLELIANEMGLRKVTLVVFDLPSEYQGIKVSYEKRDDGKVVEMRTFNVDPRLYRTLRQRFYTKLHECAYRTKAGWVLFNESREVCLKELNMVVTELNKLAGTYRAVYIIETFMPKTFLIEEIKAYIDHLKERIRNINTKIEDPEVSSKYKKQLAEEKEQLQFLIGRLMSLIDALGEKK